MKLGTRSVDCAPLLLREALITSRCLQMWMSVCRRVVCVRPCVRDFRDFCEGHMASEHSQIPFAKRALWCLQTHLKIYPRMLCLKPIFSDHFFDKKRVFTKKVPSFTRCKNFCTKSIDNHQKYTFAWCLRHTTCDKINYSGQSQIINFEK